MSVSVHDLAAQTRVTIVAGTIATNTPFTVGGMLDIKLGTDGCPTLAEDARVSIDGQDGVITTRGGEVLTAYMFGTYECDIPRFNLPVTTNASPTITLADATGTAVISGSVLAPRALTLGDAGHGRATLEWSPATDTNLSNGDVFLEQDAVETALDSTVSGSTIMVTLPTVTAATAATLRFDWFSAEATADRCDFAACKFELRHAQDVAVTLSP